MSQILKHITVSPENYDALKSLGRARDSFKEVVTAILQRLQEAQSLPTQGQIAEIQNPNNGGESTIGTS